MNILILGSGGREHAFAKKISESKRCKQLFIAPGNPGTAQFGINVPIQVTDIASVKQFCLNNKMDMLVVGPEAPLVEGITDAFRSEETKHIGVIGPDAFAAQLEGSKAFAKSFMKKYHIPTAGYLEVTTENIEAGFAFLDSLASPYVLKADGLAAGKGVVILPDLAEAKEELRAMLSGKFGAASSKVVIEEFLDGIEFSVFALTDGQHYVLLPEAKDYKKIGEGDTGLNTGGMGAISPVPFVDDTLWQKVIDKIVTPTIEGIKSENMDYTGFVFFGLIKVGNEPFVIEYNCRMGDPETEVVIPRIEDDLVEVFQDAISKKLEGKKLTFSSQSAATIMLVSGGYPGDFEKYKRITGVDDVQDSIVFHAGTTEKDGDILTSGGRVMAITSVAENFQEAIRISLKNAEKIHFEGKYFRRDIGFDL
ncbi:MAG: phosphoribosylamine--glycine ligase [Saprospiraceae bacterium]|nr:phosphoribosylamine--glycine ligase [Saprospiraceae bacterium]